MIDRAHIPNWLLGTVALIALSSCDALPTYQKSLSSVAATTRQLDQAAQAGTAGAVTTPHGQVHFADHAFVGSESTLSEHGDPLPDRTRRPDALTITAPRPIPLAQIAAEITAQTGIPTRVGELSGRRAQGTAADAAPPSLQFSYRGPLDAALGLIASKAHIDYEYRNGSLELFRFQTRTYQLAALPSDTTRLSAGINSSLTGTVSTTSSGTGTTAGGNGTNLSQLSLQSVTTLQQWKEIQAAIQALLPPGSALTASPSTGAITITAPRSAQATVQHFLDDQQLNLAQQIALDVEVITVDITDSDQYSANLAAAFANARGVAFNLASPAAVPALTAAAGSLSLGIVNAPKGSTFSNFNGTQAAIQAISTLGKTTTKYAQTFYTLNNSPVATQSDKSQGYLASISQTSIINAGNQVALTPGNIVTGFDLALLPRILRRGHLLLQVSLQVSDLISLQTIQSGGQQIQVPSVESRSYPLQRVALRSGSTLVLANFDQLRSEADDSGVGSPRFKLFGGSLTGNKTRTAILLLITPQIVNGPVTGPDDDQPSDQATGSRSPLGTVSQVPAAPTP